MLRALPRAAFALAVLTTTLGFARAASATASAELYSLAGYRYGRFRARVQFPAGDGIVGSFFLWKDGSEMATVFGNELDFEKIGADCAMQLNAIFGLPPAMHASLASGLGALCAGYHTYIYEWTPDHIAWSVDGVEVQRQTNDETSQAYRDQATLGMQFRFNLWPGKPELGGTFSSSELPAREFVSWVEYASYTPGNGDDGGDFSFAWRESFEQGIPAGWAVGNWASHFGLSTHSPMNVTFAAGVAVLSLTDDNALGFAGVPPVDDGNLPSQRGPLDAGVRDGSALADVGGDRFDAAAGDARSADASSADARGADAGNGGTPSGDAGAVDGGTAVDDGSLALGDVSRIDGGDADLAPIADTAPGMDGPSAPADASALADTSDGAAPRDDVSSEIDASIADPDSATDASATAVDALARADSSTADDASSAGDSSSPAGDGALPPPERGVPESGCGCRIASRPRLGSGPGGVMPVVLALGASLLAVATRRRGRRRRRA